MKCTSLSVLSVTKNHPANVIDKLTHNNIPKTCAFIPKTYSNLIRTHVRSIAQNNIYWNVKWFVYFHHMKPFSQNQLDSAYNILETL
jgi:hypothetical protein